MNWKIRIALANAIITFVRRHIIPTGHNYRYALRLPVLDKVNALSLKNAPIFDGERMRFCEHGMPIGKPCMGCEILQQ